MNIAHHDFESYSLCDLTSCGAYVYGQHPSTGVHCLSYELPGWARPICWKPSDPDPREFLDYIQNGGAVGAWNSQFEEHAMWNGALARLKPQWPKPRTEQFHDIMAWSYAAALPGSLEEAAKALGMPERKDTEGARIMKQVMRPRKINDDGTPVWWAPESSPEKFEKLYAYCDQDVIVEREAAKRLRPLSPSERRLWLLDQKINQRGVMLDAAAVRAASKLVSSQIPALNSRMRELADCDATNPGAILAWLRNYVPDQENLDKAAITTLLDRFDLPDVVREVLSIRQAAGKSSTAKLTAMLKTAGRDGRVRGMFKYHRATTGRWAGSLIQLHNMPRPKFGPKEASEVIELFGHPNGADCIDLGYAKPMDAISWCLRGMLVPAPGPRLIGGDFAKIEGRVLAWLAGETWKLDAFRDYDLKIGPDLYKLAYARAFDISPDEIGKDDERRQIGKVMELAFGYQGGVGSFRSMAKNYSADLAAIAEVVERTADPGAWIKAEKKRLWLQVEHGMHADLPPKIYTGLRVLVDAWRDAHPYITAFWRDLEECALSAVKYKGQVFKTATGLISFVRGEHFLYARLPSGRVLSYARPSIETVINELTGNPQQVVQYWAAGKDKETGQRKKDFAPVKSYGGLISENVTQATARDCLSEAMERLEAAGYPVVLHVHDEARCEVPNGRGSVAECTEIMGRAPAWAGGLPIAVECSELVRYHK